MKTYKQGNIIPPPRAKEIRFKDMISIKPLELNRPYKKLFGLFSTNGKKLHRKEVTCPITTKRINPLNWK